MGRKWRSPITVQGIESADGRLFNLFEYPNLPSPTRWMPADYGGHDGAVSTGVMTRTWLDGSIWWGEGEYLDDNPNAERAVQLADAGAQFWSVDPGGPLEYRFVILDANGDEVAPKDVMRAYDDIYYGDDEDGKKQDWLDTLRELIVFDLYTVGAVTQLDIPCFPEARVALVDAPAEPAPAAARAEVPEGARNVTPDLDGQLRARRLLRRLAAGPATRPAGWYQRQANLTRYTPYSISDEGQITGHIAGWNSCHRGFTQRCIKPPYQTDFADFHTGWAALDDGSRMRVGVITHVEGHLRTIAEYTRCAEDPACQLGSARLYADKWGIQISGSVHPDVPAAQVTRALAGAPSGDWRGIPGGERLFGLAIVNTPGHTAIIEEHDGQNRMVASIPPPGPDGFEPAASASFFDAPPSIITAACACQGPVVTAVAETDSEAAGHADCGCGGGEGACTCETARLKPADLEDLAHLDAAMRTMRQPSKV